MCPQSAVNARGWLPPCSYSPHLSYVIVLAEARNLRVRAQKTPPYFARDVTNFAYRRAGAPPHGFPHPPFSSPIKKCPVEELSHR